MHAAGEAFRLHDRIHYSFSFKLVHSIIIRSYLCYKSDANRTLSVANSIVAHQLAFGESSNTPYSTSPSKNVGIRNDMVVFRQGVGIGSIKPRKSIECTIRIIDIKLFAASANSDSSIPS